MEEQIETRFQIKFEPFKAYKDPDVAIEDIEDKKWMEVAQALLGETNQVRDENLQILKAKAEKIGLVLPFLAEEGLTEEQKLYLEQRFWIMVLRAGAMDAEKAFEVLMKYLKIMHTFPQYFASSKPPTKMDYIYQQQVVFVLVLSL